MLRALLSFLLAGGLAGCVHDSLKTQYRPTIGIAPRAPHQGNVEVFESFALLDDVDKKVKDGYVVIGTSAYSTEDVPSTDEVIVQAKKVGASLVVMSNEFDQVGSLGMRGANPQTYREPSLVVSPYHFDKRSIPPANSFDVGGGRSFKVRIYYLAK